jgi:hypothetical protein
MATILTLAGGFLGLFAAILALVLFHASVLTALALWCATGISATLLGLVWSAIPRRETAMIRA